jgi:hypothetical protein
LLLEQKQSLRVALHELLSAEGQTLDLPVRGLLPKPFDAEELLDCVARSIAQPSI